jgi:hypothetical protein
VQVKYHTASGIFIALIFQQLMNGQDEQWLGRAGFGTGDSELMSLWLFCLSADISAIVDISTLRLSPNVS